METPHATHLYDSSEPLAFASGVEGLGDDGFDAFLRAASLVPESQDAAHLVGPLHAAAAHAFSLGGPTAPHAQRAEAAFRVLTRYGLPCTPLERPDAWAVAVGPYALHLDAYTACRIERPTAGTFAVAGAPYPVADGERLVDLQGWALRVALHRVGAGAPVEGATACEAEDIAALEARLAEAQSGPTARGHAAGDHA